MVFHQLMNQLQALAGLITNLSDEQFTKPVRHLGGATIGAHTRHIIEILQCTLKGYALGTIDYFNRVRDLQLEKDRSKGLIAIDNLMGNMVLPDKPLNVVANTGDGNDQPCVQSSYFREIVFNAEHATHHMALIRVALMDMNLEIVSHDFGVAASTLKFKAKQQCAQ